ncbi:hypothetical protein Y1Q_0023275 [Alligator mississippiensis]|uniref:Uncharacterized protein n=1 Tax=Alligator mississippiensis TaxID=8496 RepID=A0A151MJ89_ALLMI|nr:hypothetical protein Y1Q_0023275 [Alligator mississippiensis]
MGCTPWETAIVGIYKYRNPQPMATALLAGQRLDVRAQFLLEERLEALERQPGPAGGSEVVAIRPIQCSPRGHQTTLPACYPRGGPQRREASWRSYRLIAIHGTRGTDQEKRCSTRNFSMEEDRTRSGGPFHRQSLKYFRKEVTVIIPGGG